MIAKGHCKIRHGDEGDDEEAELDSMIPAAGILSNPSSAPMQIGLDNIYSPHSVLCRSAVYYCSMLCATII